MHEAIEQRNRQVFLQQLFGLNSLLMYGLSIGIGQAVAYAIGFGGWWSPMAIAVTGVGFGATAVHSKFASIDKRWHHARFRHLWNECDIRYKKFWEASRALGKARVATLTDLPENISSLRTTLYNALRRADQLDYEIHLSEHGFTEGPNVKLLAGKDPQAQALYRAAEQNIAEYRRHLAQVRSGINRAEGQAALFMTTLDALRVRMLGHRFAGVQAEAETESFMQAITEARMQLDAIDKALHEIEHTPFPQSITVMPGDPLLGESVRETLENTPPPFVPRPPEFNEERVRGDHDDQSGAN